MKQLLPIWLLLTTVLTLSIMSSPVVAFSADGAPAGGAGDQNGPKFSDHDRQAVHNYAEGHKYDQGFNKQDQLSAQDEDRLKPGSVLDDTLRKKSHHVPPDLARELSPAPHGYHYVVTGGHVCLMDYENKICDVADVNH